MIEIIKAAFTAGEIKTFMIQGEYLEILEAAYPVDVFMMDRSGAQLSTMRNAEASYFSRPGKYEVIQVTSSAAQTIRLFVGSGDAGTRRTSGDVSIIDGGKNRTISGVAYMGYIISQESANQFSRGQIFNPAGSGKNLVVKNVYVSQTNSGGFEIGTTQTAFASIQGTKPGNKKIGGPATVAVMREENSPLPFITGTPFLFGYLMGSSTFTVQLAEPFIVTPGFSLYMWSAVTETKIVMTVDYFEAPI